jgi:hypothetical protein
VSITVAIAAHIAASSNLALMCHRRGCGAGVGGHSLTERVFSSGSAPSWSSASINAVPQLRNCDGVVGGLGGEQLFDPHPLVFGEPPGGLGGEQPGDHLDVPQTRLS